MKFANLKLQNALQPLFKLISFTAMVLKLFKQKKE